MPPLFRKRGLWAGQRFANHGPPPRSTPASRPASQSYDATLGQLRIEAYISKLLTGCQLLMSLPFGDRVAFSPGRLHSQHYNEVERLRDSIDVLFAFQRQEERDEEFNFQICTWLDRLVSALMRIASHQDHRYLLNHIIRFAPCLGRISQNPTAQSRSQIPVLPSLSCRRGQGAKTTNYIQFPPAAEWTDETVDHIIAMLSTLLGPVAPFEPSSSANLISSASSAGAAAAAAAAARGSAPRSRASSLSSEDPLAEPDRTLQHTVSTDDWVVMDTDGSTVSLKAHSAVLDEDDYLAILEQFPLDDLLAYVLRCRPHAASAAWRTRAAGEPHSPDSVMQLFALCTVLIQVLGTVFHDEARARFHHFILRVSHTILKVGGEGGGGEGGGDRSLNATCSLFVSSGCAFPL